MSQGRGTYEKKPGKWVKMGSCQWCHYTYGYNGAGNITDTLNGYGEAYDANGRNAAAISAISTNATDSDADGYSNLNEIQSLTYPGNDNDHPGLQQAPYRIYTRAQLEALPQQTEFLLMNTSRSGDFYAEYTGVPMKDLLDDAGILPSATDITVYAPDGWAQSHPLEYNDDIEMYHVYGNMPEQAFQYPPATYYYNVEADIAKTLYGWCDYSAASCIGRSNGDQIVVDGGLKAILAIKREGAYLDSGVLNDENSLDGEGPYRVVVPQKSVNAPDQSSNADKQDVIWPYVEDWDHNAGSCTRSATIIRIDPMPEGFTDIDVLEAGWPYIDQKKIIIYGAIDGTDSNGNGILDSEEKTNTNATSDFDGDGIFDYQDPDTASFRPASFKDASGLQQRVKLNSSKGEFANIQALTDDDPALDQTGKPTNQSFPYGAFSYRITGLTAGDSVDVELAYPDPVPTDAQFYKITAAGWQATAFDRKDEDNHKVTLKLTDGDPATDADGEANGVIVDPVALSLPSSGGGGGSCFIRTLLD